MIRLHQLVLSRLRGRQDSEHEQALVRLAMNLPSVPSAEAHGYALRHLGLAPRRPYQMRHTAATLWLASGEAPEWIARQLGHASTEMLFRVYSRYVPNLTRRDGSAIDRLLASRFAGITEAPSAPPQLPKPHEQPPPLNAGEWALAA